MGRTVKLHGWHADSGLQSSGVRLEIAHCGVQDTWLVAPEKENPRAHMAISALARALDKTKKGCIIRFVPRANQAVFVGCATPLLGDTDKPDCLVLNYLPFTGVIVDVGYFPLDHARRKDNVVIEQQYCWGLIGATANDRIDNKKEWSCRSGKA